MAAVFASSCTVCFGWDGARLDFPLGGGRSKNSALCIKRTKKFSAEVRL
jgi:hypothetical protein